MLENQFKKKVSKELRKYPQVYIYSVVDRVTAGIPDFILCVDGQFIGLELKCEKRDVTRAQAFWAKKICDAGGHYFVMRHLDDGNTIEISDYMGRKEGLEFNIKSAVLWVID